MCEAETHRGRVGRIRREAGRNVFTVRTSHTCTNVHTHTCSVHLPLLEAVTARCRDATLAMTIRNTSGLMIEGVVQVAGAALPVFIV